MELVLLNGPAGKDFPLSRLHLKMEANSVLKMSWVLQTDTMNKVQTLSVECDHAVTV